MNYQQELNNALREIDEGDIAHWQAESYRNKEIANTKRQQLGAKESSLQRCKEDIDRLDKIMRKETFIFS